MTALSYGERISREGVAVVAIPKTMDNDVYGTDYCIGFSSAVSRSVTIIQQLRSSAGSHERIAIIELFGRNCGETSLLASYLAGVDRAIIPEVPFDPQRLAELIMEDKHANPSNYAIVTVSEGAHMVGGTAVEYGEADGYGHRKLGGIGLITGDALKKITGEEILYQQLGYLMRSGPPDSLDLMVPVNYATIALRLADRCEYGRLVVLKDGRYTSAPIGITQQGIKRADASAGAAHAALQVSRAGAALSGALQHRLQPLPPDDSSWRNSAARGETWSAYHGQHDRDRSLGRVDSNAAARQLPPSLT